MKTLKLLALASAFLFVCAGMTSCNKDNGGKDADPVVGKFEIKDASSPVKCIELTSDGEYIVTKNPVITRSDDDLDLDAAARLLAAAQTTSALSGKQYATL